MKLPPAYNPAEYESNIYALWEKKGAFLPVDRGGEGYFSMVMPPPNANGSLHMGHGLTNAIQDTLIRYHRLKGKPTLYVPGADHAGFETWVVYEKKLNQKGKSRFDFSREELYRQVWDFVQQNKHNFEAQLRALGASCDWTRFTFTLDNKVVATAYQTFQKMWEDKLIYRGQRIVNFCTFHGTSFADIEVVHKEEQGKLWHIKYPLLEGQNFITVATTRPETMLGDTAVAVNPKDARYKVLVGKTVKLPLTNREIPIVADEMVDRKFGSGAVKITPAHDPNDFEVAQRHKLPAISVIGTDGKITTEAPEAYRGLPAEEARSKVLEDLKKANLVVDEVNYAHSVGHCYKCDTVIEPLLREQWFVSMRPLADRAIKELKDDKITFYPENKKAQTICYLEEVKDWNLSRQIAWGIPIPAFQNVDDPSDWIYDTRVHEDTIEVGGKKYKRDPDTFDTWFSSGQWPYVTLDYPGGEDFERFYPNTLMETGGEILYQWVARMIMLGLYKTDEAPFKNVYIHGYVLAEDGQKMSKSLGNVIDPLDVIGEYGSDALRMGLLTGRRAGVNQGFHPSKIVAGRNFSNKLWNVARFIESKVEGEHSLRAQGEPNTPADHWILQRLNATSKEISRSLDNYRLSEAYEALYNFVWHDFADWYIEVSKTEINTPLLAYVLEATLKLAHPFAPFVTETIWQTLAWESFDPAQDKEDTMLATQKWPEIAKSDSREAKKFDDIMTIVTEIRHIISVLGLKKPHLYYQYSEPIVEQVDLILQLARLGGVTESKTEAQEGLRLTNTEYAVWLEVDSETAFEYIKDLKAQQTERRSTIKRLEGRLNNKNYVSKAPKQVVEQTRTQLKEEQSLLTTLERELAAFIRASRGL